MTLDQLWAAFRQLLELLIAELPPDDDFTTNLISLRDRMNVG